MKIMTKWSEEQVRDFLSKEKLSYQNIEMPYGLSTGGDDRSYTCQKIFPDDLTGKTVLDVGCKYGYFCIEAIKRGAKKVVGIDFDRDNIRKARLIADCLGFNITYELFDIETDSLQETYDYVLCLNVLHHLKNPISVIDKLVKATNEKLILEIASLGRRDRKKLKITPLTSLILNRFPVMFIAGNEKANQFKDHKFFMSPSAIRRLLLDHNSVFANVDIIPSEFKNRFITIALKRRIGKLVVVAGPVASGKHTLIDKLLKKELPQIFEILDIKDVSSWKTISARRLHELTCSDIDNLIVHYDIKRPFFKNTDIYSRDSFFDLLEIASEVFFITLWTSAPVLIEQLDKRFSEAVDGKKLSKKTYVKLRNAYRDEEKIRDVYKSWIKLCQKKSVKHIIVSLDKGVHVYRDDSWQLLEKN